MECFCFRWLDKSLERLYLHGHLLHWNLAPLNPPLFKFLVWYVWYWLFLRNDSLLFLLLSFGEEVSAACFIKRLTRLLCINDSLSERLFDDFSNELVSAAASSSASSSLLLLISLLAFLLFSLTTFFFIWLRLDDEVTSILCRSIVCLSTLPLYCDAYWQNVHSCTFIFSMWNSLRW